MTYAYSSLDRKNLRWIKNDTSKGTLRKIRLSKGSLRGLYPFEISLKYPITAIAGANGSGKSTLLAIAACAYHNHRLGFNLADKKNPYYTFSDFFVQSSDETPPEGIEIWYQILYDNWRGGKVGPAWQLRRKRVGGKWNNYDARVNRNVAYFGIQRVVPHYERSTHKSYRGRFQGDSLKESHKQEICAAASRIIGKTYSSFEKRTHSKYYLPVAIGDGVKYSGFNMGAGESAVFEILSSLFEAGEGSLLIIDELELGLHEKAQVRLVDELKILCEKLHCQIICSTHSHVVLKTLPPEGRFFLETVGDKTNVIPRISSDYACGKLRGTNTAELDVYVEDDVAAMILQLGLPHRLRQRISVSYIGSADALIRLMASRYLEKRDTFLCILDGDKKSQDEKNKSRFRKYAETKFRESEQEMRAWADKRLTYLPSDVSPEKWLIRSCQIIQNKTPLATAWGIDDVGLIEDALETAALARSHGEFFALSEEIKLPEERITGDLVRFVLRSNPGTLDNIIEIISEHFGE